MDNSTLKLVLTHEGKNFFKYLLNNNDNKTIDFMIALGTSSQPPSPDDQDLIEGRIRIISSIVELTPNRSELHLNAYFPAEYEIDNEFNVHEVGVYAVFTNHHEFLLGRYASKEVITKKNRFSDLFIDLIIDLTIDFPVEIDPNLLEDRNSYFIPTPLAHASEEKYGVVLLATKEDIKNKKSKRVLTTDLLSEFSKDKQPDTSWSIAPPVTVHTGRDHNFLIGGMHFLDLEKKKLMILMMNGSNIGDCLHYIIYDFEDQNKDFRITHLQTPALLDVQRIKVYAYYKENFSFLINIHDQGKPNNKILEVFFDNNPNLNSRIQNINANLLSFERNADIDSPLMLGLDDNYFLLVNCLNKSSNKIFIANNKQGISPPIFLKSYRRNPILEKIGNNIYIIGGDEHDYARDNTPGKERNYDKEPIQTVEILNLNNYQNQQPSLFSPIIPVINELRITAGVFSCVNGYMIYIFFKENFTSQKKEKRYYYRYNTLSHLWEKKRIPDSIRIHYNETIFSASAINDGEAIHLFFLTIVTNNSLALQRAKLTVKN